MTAENAQLTRQYLQDEALIIETLLEAAQALTGPGNEGDMLLMVEMAAKRAKRMNEALDGVNAPELKI